MGGAIRSQRGAVHLHVHTGATGAPQTADSELEAIRTRLGELEAVVTVLRATDDATAANVNVLANRLYAALGGNVRRRLRRSEEYEGDSYEEGIARVLAPTG